MEDARVVRRSDREVRGMCGPSIEWIVVQRQRKSIRVGTESRASPTSPPRATASAKMRIASAPFFRAASPEAGFTVG